MKRIGSIVLALLLTCAYLAALFWSLVGAHPVAFAAILLVGAVGAGWLAARARRWKRPLLVGTGAALATASLGAVIAGGATYWVMSGIAETFGDEEPIYEGPRPLTPQEWAPVVQQFTTTLERAEASAAQDLATVSCGEPASGSAQSLHDAVMRCRTVVSALPPPTPGKLWWQGASVARACEPLLPATAASKDAPRPTDAADPVHRQLAALVDGGQYDDAFLLAQAAARLCQGGAPERCPFEPRYGAFAEWVLSRIAARSQARGTGADAARCAKRGGRSRSLADLLQDAGKRWVGDLDGDGALDVITVFFPNPSVPPGRLQIWRSCGGAQLALDEEVQLPNGLPSEVWVERASKQPPRIAVSGDALHLLLRKSHGHYVPTSPAPMDQPDMSWRLWSVDTVAPHISFCPAEVIRPEWGI